MNVAAVLMVVVVLVVIGGGGGGGGGVDIVIALEQVCVCAVLLAVLTVVRSWCFCECFHRYNA